MSITIRSPHFSTHVNKKNNGFCNLTGMARNLRLDYFELSDNLLETG